MHTAEHEPPLVVDLDGTLLKTDLLVESANDVLAHNPLKIGPMMLWLRQGRHMLKANLARDCKIDAATLPYNKAIVAWLHQQKALGRTIILATASHKSLADQVAAHLGLFNEVLATESDINLKGARKRDALVSRFGEQGFDYVGNDRIDIPVWQAARHAYVVSTSPGLIAEAQSLGNVAEVFPTEQPPVMPALFKALRPHQWLKNLLVFVPLLAAHQFTDGKSFFNALLAFLIFGLTASSVYVLNDLIDVADDRHHHRKRNRPFAGGNLSLLVGWSVWPGLILVAFVIAFMALPLAFVGVLAIYCVLTLGYSLRLKQSAMIDVLMLAGLYTIRIVAGAAAITVPVSFWLLTFSMFIFLSLAFIKRFSELKVARNNNFEGNIRGRGYVHQDLELVSSMGSSAGYLAVLVLALYIHDAHTANLYAMPQLIWLACPLLLYWISRAWLIAHRGQMHDDPIVFAIKDKTSWVVGICFIGIFGLAKVLG